MTLSIRPIDPVSRPFFAGEVSGIDITKRTDARQAASIEKGMDQYGVLVFHGQHSTTKPSWRSPATSARLRKPAAT